MPDWPQRPRKAAGTRSSRFTISRLRSRPVQLTGKGLRHTTCLPVSEDVLELDLPQVGPAVPVYLAGRHQLFEDDKIFGQGVYFAEEAWPLTAKASAAPA